MWVSDCFFFYKMCNLSGISWPDQIIFWWDDDDEVLFVLDQHTEQDFYSASSLKLQSAQFWQIILIPIQPVIVLTS